MSKTSKMQREYPCSNERERERVKNKVLFFVLYITSEAFEVQEKVLPQNF
jgi:hypothetical protein